MRLHIHGHNLPASTPDSSPDSSGNAGTPSVGVQRGREVTLVQDRATATGHWVIDADLASRPDGTVDLRGPWVQGRPGDRFVYLSWGLVSGAGEFAMVRRAKLMLDAVDPDLLRAAEGAGDEQALIATLSLTGPDGTPVCAAVRPPSISWTVGGCPRTS